MKLNNPSAQSEGLHESNVTVNDFSKLRNDLVMWQTPEIHSKLESFLTQFDEFWYLGEVSIKACEMTRLGLIQEYSRIHSQTPLNFNHKEFSSPQPGQQFNAEEIRRKLLSIKQNGKKVFINASQGYSDIANGLNLWDIIKECDMQDNVCLWAPSTPTLLSGQQECTDFYDELDDKVKFAELTNIAVNTFGLGEKYAIPALEVDEMTKLDEVKNSFGIKTANYPIFLQIANGSAAGSGTYCIKEERSDDNNKSIEDIINAISIEGVDPQTLAKPKTLRDILATIMHEKKLSSSQFINALQTGHIIDGDVTSKFRLKLAKGIIGGYAENSTLEQPKYLPNQAINGEIAVFDDKGTPAVYFGAVTDKPMGAGYKSLGNSINHGYPQHIIKQIQDLYTAYGKTIHSTGYRGMIGIDLMWGIEYDPTEYEIFQMNHKIQRDENGHIIAKEKKTGMTSSHPEFDIVVCNEFNPRRQGPHSIRSLIAHKDGLPDLATLDLLYKVDVQTIQNEFPKADIYNKNILESYDIAYAKIDQNKVIQDIVHNTEQELQTIFEGNGENTSIGGVYKIQKDSSGALIDLLKQDENYESYGLLQYILDQKYSKDEHIFIKGFDATKVGQELIENALNGEQVYDAINIYGQTNTVIYNEEIKKRLLYTIHDMFTKK